MTKSLRGGIGRVHSGVLFRALVALDSPYLERDGRQFRLNSGMLVSAEIHLGTRMVMEYLLSPVSKTLHEAGREL